MSYTKKCKIGECRALIANEFVFCRHHWLIVPQINKNMMAMTFEAGVIVDRQSLSFHKASLDAAKAAQLLEAVKKQNGEL